MAEDSLKNKQKWMQVLAETHRNYMRTVTLFSDLQNEFKNTLDSVKKRQYDFKDDTVKAIKNWLDKGNEIQKEFQKLFTDALKRTISLIPENFDFPLNEKIEKVFKDFEDNFKKAIEQNPLNWLFKY
jgi:hypothetical protein